MDGQFRSANRVVYGATKSYVEAFYEGLNRDFSGKIDFTLLEIGPVKTNMLKNDLPFIVSSGEFASECINLISKYKFIQGCKKHALLRTLLFLPGVNNISRNLDQKINKE